MLNFTTSEHAADYGPLRIARRVSLAGTGSPGPAFFVSPATPCGHIHGLTLCGPRRGVVFDTAEDF